eukprot:TRINITY_DN26676_c0_g1_i5.p1 TRINITY_DN26676_c0_g1~~TRINITY_DN26676_c0_g1_i5.p1  ORF type:complete len:660 (+),score=160.01 TRINITY_DN26676_c0_g1_i5:107-2086(+)
MKHIPELWVEVVEGKDFPRMDSSFFGGLADPYCILHIPELGLEQQSSVVSNTRSPQWGEEFRFPIDTKRLELQAKKISHHRHTAHIDVKLRIEVLDHDRVGKDEEIGFLEVDILEELSGEQVYDIWYSLLPPESLSAKGREKKRDRGEIHIRMQFAVTESGFLQRVQKMTSLKYYEPLISLFGRQLKDPVAITTMFRNAPVPVIDSIIRILSDVPDLLLSLVDCVANDEIEETSSVTGILRGNSFRTKILGQFAAFVGLPYLLSLLRNCVEEVEKRVESSGGIGAFEVDVNRLPDSSRGSKDGQPAVPVGNHERLSMLAAQVIDRVFSGIEDVPHSLKHVCACLRSITEKKFGPAGDCGARAAGALFFLRFLNPVFITPHLFGIVTDAPSPQTLRVLMLISKVIQNLANGADFGGKESYMMPMNALLIQYQESMLEFLEKISSPSPSPKDGGEKEERGNWMPSVSGPCLLGSLYQVHVFLYYDFVLTIAPSSAAQRPRNKTFSMSYTIREGSLMKKGEKRKSWKRRWIVLQRGMIRWYQNESKTKQKGSLSIFGCSVRGEKDSHDRPLILIDGTSRCGGMFVMRCESAKERDAWMDDIRFACRDPTDPRISSSAEVPITARPTSEPIVYVQQLLLSKLFGPPVDIGLEVDRVLKTSFAH